MALDDVLPRVPELRATRASSRCRRAHEHELQGHDAGRRATSSAISGKDTGLLAIDRENEFHNTIAAAETGVGAPVVAALPEHDALVLDFLEGEVMGAEKLRRGDRLRAVAAACRARCMPARPLPATTSTCSRSSARYLDDRPASAASGCPTATSSSSRRCARSSARCACATRRTVPCNNDLLAENFIDVGERLPADRLRVLRQQRAVVRARQRLERVEPLARAARGARRALLRPPAASTRSRARGCGA